LSNDYNRRRYAMKREMKVVLVICFGVIILGGAATPGQAIFTAEDGCLVPYAYYNDTTDTMIGLITWAESGYVYWSFMSPDGVQWGHGWVSADVAYKIPFSLKNADGNAHPDQVGYVIFTYDDEDEILQTAENRSEIAANAVLLSAGDAAFIPVIPLDRSDYAHVDLSLHTMNAGSIVGLSYGYPAIEGISVNFWIDPLFEAETYLVIWCSESPPAAFDADIYSVDDFNFDEVTFTRNHQVLNVYNVATDAIGFDSGAVDGFMDVYDGGGQRFMFSLITSNAFSAIQTMVGFYRPGE
jgi:hypothetical protein